MTEPTMPADSRDMVQRLTRPIIGIENRTAQEVFDIMSDRIRSALSASPARGEGDGAEKRLRDALVMLVDRAESIRDTSIALINARTALAEAALQPQAEGGGR